MDGDIDYSKFSRGQLTEALTRIDRVSYPRNCENLQKELDTRAPEPRGTPKLPETSASATNSSQNQWERTLLALIARYALLLFLLQVMFGFLLGEIRLLIFHGSFDSLFNIYLCVRFIGSAAIAFAVFYQLARHHHRSLPEAAVGVAVVTSVLTIISAYFDPSVKTFHPISVLAAALSLNLLLAFLAIRVFRNCASTMPANQRLERP